MPLSNRFCLLKFGFRNKQSFILKKKGSMFFKPAALSVIGNVSACRRRGIRFEFEPHYLIIETLKCYELLLYQTHAIKCKVVFKNV